MTTDREARMAGVQQDYWFDMELTGDAKVLRTYAYGGFLVDTQTSEDGAASWSDLIAAATPAIQTDVDYWGVIQ